MVKEGVFRVPRLKTNKILERYAHIFSGEIINVSGASDSDKDCSLYEYYFGNYDSGKRYRDYFINADNYYVSNYPFDKTSITLDKTDMLFFDLEHPIPDHCVGGYDVVYNHTVLEHVFDIFSAFENLCLLSKDIVILVVPQFQRIHDYRRGYKDYWRFTPFAIDKLFSLNGFKVLFRETTTGFSESMYLFYIASKDPAKWENHFPALTPIEEYINSNNDGLNYTRFSSLILRFDAFVRRVFKKRS